MIDSHYHSVRAFLDQAQLSFVEKATKFRWFIPGGLSSDDDDAKARERARYYVGELGKRGILEPIRQRDWRSCCIAREALAYWAPLADAVFAIQALGALPVLLGGRDDAMKRWADDAIEGKAMGGFAMTEPEAGSDVAAIATTARRVGDEYVLNGKKTFISNAGIADFYAVFASTDPAARGRGISCFLVPADTPGLRFTRALFLSAPHPLGELAFEDCRVPAANLLGEEERGLPLGLSVLDRLRPTVGAAACGMAARAFDEAFKHARQREQFGKPIVEYQLVQEKLARMAIELTAARLMVYRAAWEADQGSERITLEAAMAKAHATEAAQRIVDDAVQVLGGAGVMKSHPVDYMYRAVRALRIYEGTTEIQHLVIAGQLLKQARGALKEFTSS